MRKMIPANQGEFLQKLYVKGNGDVNGLLNIANLVDANGHQRFIEGDITFEEITGVSKVYGKRSLSGSHLMIVACPKIDDETVLSNITLAYLDDIPQWIKDKIIPVASTLVSNFSVVCFNETASSTQSMPVYLRKTSEHLYIVIGSITATDDRYTRIVFDLLIDSEAGE